MKMVARFIPIVIMVLLVAALSASPVLANPGHEGKHGKGNGGNGGKGGNNTQSSGTLELSQTSTGVSVSGSGFASNTATFVIATSNGHTGSYLVESDGSGSFAFEGWNLPSGEYTFSVCQKIKKSWECGLGVTAYDVY